MPDEKSVGMREKILIIHADDFGLCEAVNRAVLAAFDANAITSASIMPPCPAFRQAAAGAVLRRPALDVGVHLTITSEWKACKWGPVSDAMGPGGTDESGHFLAASEQVARSCEHVLPELTAQIARAKAAGLVPTHIDTHMFALFSRWEFFCQYMAAAAHANVPALVPPAWREHPAVDGLLPRCSVALDAIVQIGPEVPASAWLDFYVH